MRRRGRPRIMIDYDNIRDYARRRIDSLYEQIDKQPTTERRIYRKDILCELYHDFGKIKSYKEARDMLYEKRGEEIKHMAHSFGPKGDSDIGRAYRKARERYLTLLQMPF